MTNKAPKADKSSEDNLVAFNLKGTFSFRTYDGPGAHYEPYGSLKFDIGERAENQDYEAWSSKKGELNIPDNQPVTFKVDHWFREYADFLEQGRPDTTVKLRGKVMEWDTGRDDLIIDYGRYSYRAYYLYANGAEEEQKNDGAVGNFTLNIFSGDNAKAAKGDK